MDKKKTWAPFDVPQMQDPPVMLRDPAIWIGFALIGGAAGFLTGYGNLVLFDGIMAGLVGILCGLLFPRILGLLPRAAILCTLAAVTVLVAGIRYLGYAGAGAGIIFSFLIVEIFRRLEQGAA